MARKVQINSFEKGMNKSLTKDRLPPTSYRNAKNFRLNDDKGESSGSLVNVLGNELEFEIPASPTVYKVSPIPGVEEPGSGLQDTFAITTFTGSISEQIYLTSGGFEDYFNQVVDLANDPTSAIAQAGIKIIRTSSESITVYSDTVTITGVNTTQSNFTRGVKFADRQENLEIIGKCVLRDSIILFTTNDDSIEGGNGQIWEINYNRVTNEYSIEIRYTNDSILFSKRYPIEAVGRFENNNTQRVYWTDNFNKVRSLNIASLTTSMGVDESFLNLNPSVNFSKPVLNTINSGGTLKAGVYQYAYRLTSSTGAQTKVSPASNLINLMNPSESGTEWSQLGEYSGTNPGDATTKSITIDIKNIDSTYDTIEFIYLYYGAAEATPEIFIFESTEIPSSGEVSVTHTGSEVTSDLSESEYKSFGIPFETAKTISYQDNRLLVANTKSPKNEKLKFHARAYRFGNNNTDVDTSGNPLPYNSSNSFQVINADSKIRTYVPGLDINQDNWGYEDPENEEESSVIRDAINPYNRPDWVNNFLPFKWQADGETLGGEGPYVKYKFTTTDELDGGNLKGYNYDGSEDFNSTAPLLETPKGVNSYSLGTNSEVYTVRNSILNHKSPYINNLLRGYFPGEVYRFGIVLYDKAGNPGFVNWIGDIKFPERWEIKENGLRLNDSPYGEDLVELGLDFTINLPSDILEEISGYEIVRVKRGIQDRTKVAQGIANILAQVDSDDKLYLFPKKSRDTNDFEWNVSGMSADADTDAYPSNQAVGDYPAAALQSLVIYSPEFQFFNNIGFSNKDRLRFEATANNSHRKNPTVNLELYHFSTYTDTNKALFTAFSGGYGDPTNGNAVKTNGKSSVPISFAREVDPGQEISVVPGLGTGFINATVPSADLVNTNEPQVDGAKCLFIKLEDGLRLALPAFSTSEASLSGIADSDLLVTYERNIIDQYGGNTQAARANNTYIRTGGFIKTSATGSTTQIFQVFGGDCFVNMYDLTRTDGDVTREDDVNNCSRDGMVYPLQSTFNTTLRNGRHLLNKALPNGDYPATSDTDYSFDTFEIEDVYSRQDDYVAFIGRQLTSENLEIFDNRVYASNAKINGELVDNWRQFPTFLYKDVEGAFGGINRLLNHQDNVYYFQDRACGYLLINPRGQVSSGGAGSLQIGFGGILHDFEYLSTEVGCSFQWMPISTNDNIFFIDLYQKQMYMIRGKQVIPISLQKGMNPWLFENLTNYLLEKDNPIRREGICSTWDKRFNEIWFTFLNKTLKFEAQEKALYEYFRFSSDNLYDYAISITTSNLGTYSPVVGETIVIEIDGNEFEHVIEEIEVDGTKTYYRISGEFYGSYSQYNNAFDASGNMMEKTKFSDLYQETTNNPNPVYLTIKFLDSVENTLVFNEAYDIYTSFYDFYPSIYLNDGINILSPNPASPSDLYKHNSGDYCSFYGNVFSSILEIIANDSRGYTKVFDSISFHTEVFENDASPISIYNETFNQIRFYTDYQNSDWVTLDPSNKHIRRVDKEWQLPISRNAVLKSFGASPIDVDIFDTNNLDQSQKFKDRLRDKYLTIELDLNNLQNRRFLLNYLKTFYRLSVR